MSANKRIKVFEDKEVRKEWNEQEQDWYVAIVDVVSVLTDSVDPGAYWRKLKERLKKEGNETVTSCHALKMKAADGKMRSTDVANTKQLLRLIQYFGIVAIGTIPPRNLRAPSHKRHIHPARQQVVPLYEIPAFHVTQDSLARQR